MADEGKKVTADPVVVDTLNESLDRKGGSAAFHALRAAMEKSLRETAAEMRRKLEEAARSLGGTHAHAEIEAAGRAIMEELAHAVGMQAERSTLEALAHGRPLVDVRGYRGCIEVHCKICKQWYWTGPPRDDESAASKIRLVHCERCRTSESHGAGTPRSATPNSERTYQGGRFQAGEW